jgi:hypothetical protein
MSNNIIYGRHKIAFQTAEGLLLLMSCRTVSEDLHMIDNILGITQKAILQKHGYCMICVDCAVLRDDACYLLKVPFAIKRITKLDVFYIH